LLLGRECHEHRVGDIHRYVGLNPENIREIPIVRTRPQMLVRYTVDQLCSDAGSVTVIADTAFEYGRNVELTRDLRHR
jgi:hypothetical protein